MIKSRINDTVMHLKQGRDTGRFSHAILYAFALSHFFSRSLRSLPLGLSHFCIFALSQPEARGETVIAVTVRGLRARLNITFARESCGARCSFRTFGHFRGRIIFALSHSRTFELSHFRTSVFSARFCRFALSRFRTFALSRFRTFLL